MKNISTNLRTFLLGATLTGMQKADLCSIQLSNGDTLNVCWGTNQNIVYNGTTYYVSQFGSWERGAFENKAEFRPNAGTMQLSASLANTFAADSTNAVYYPGTTTPMIAAVNAGLFNGAVVTIQTIFWPLGIGPYTTFNMSTYGGVGTTSGVGMGTMKLNTGQMGSAKNAGRSKVDFDVFDYLYILNRPFPPHNIQSQCRNVLGDFSCQVNLSNFTTTTQTVNSNSTTLYIDIPAAAHQTSHAYTKGNLIVISNVLYYALTSGTSAGSAPSFVTTFGQRTTDGGVTWVSWGSIAPSANVQDQAMPLGYITWLTGQNEGLQGSIKVQTSTTISSVLYVQIQLARPTALPVIAGDTFTITAGCNKSLATCASLFQQSNSGRSASSLDFFSGMPYVPNPESAGV